VQRNLPHPDGLLATVGGGVSSGSIHLRLPGERSAAFYLRLLGALALGALIALLASYGAARGDGRTTGGAAASTGTGTSPSVTVSVPGSTTTAPVDTTTTGTTTTSTTPAYAPPPSGGARNPLGGRAMWIWVLARSDGGNLNRIVARARKMGVSTLIIKSGDGSGTWSQFNPQLVSALHANHLRVCAWQYVYGNHPAAEANVGAQSVADGADCLIIDAETEYEGKYVSAQTYIKDLRTAIGPRYPLVLAGFPYVDYHPAFPYSVFLGPNGAQYNAPQMYWKDIGVSVDVVYAHTFVFNAPFRRAIFPLGQVYDNPPPAQIRRFRQLSRAYGTGGVSWWDWQEATAKGWAAISQPVGAIANFTPDTAMATVGQHARGDLVVWAQEHLRSAGEQVNINGNFDASMLAAVKDFQATQGLTVDGLIGTMTWGALLRYKPVKVTWVAKGSKVTAQTAAANRFPVPASASLRARRNEIAHAGGAGSPR
jgi:peptidoglycan hydrolase-like protein with peptidoglycan-binding domain